MVLQSRKTLATEQEIFRDDSLPLSLVTCPCTNRKLRLLKSPSNGGLTTSYPNGKKDNCLRGRLRKLCDVDMQILVWPAAIINILSHEDTQTSHMHTHTHTACWYTHVKAPNECHLRLTNIIFSRHELAPSLNNAFLDHGFSQKVSSLREDSTMWICRPHNRFKHLWTVRFAAGLLNQQSCYGRHITECLLSMSPRVPSLTSFPIPISWMERDLRRVAIGQVKIGFSLVTTLSFLGF